MGSGSYSIPYRYIATLDSEYFVRNDIRLWQRVCTNGLFDIWNPGAPEERLNNSLLYREDPRCARIQLLRLHEICEQFDLNDVRDKGARVHHLVAANRNVTIKRPIVDDAEFLGVKQLFEDSVANYIVSPHLR